MNRHISVSLYTYKYHKISVDFSFFDFESFVDFRQEFSRSDAQTWQFGYEEFTLK